MILFDVFLFINFIFVLFVYMFVLLILRGDWHIIPKFPNPIEQSLRGMVALVGGAFGIFSGFLGNL